MSVFPLLFRSLLQLSERPARLLDLSRHGLEL